MAPMIVEATPRRKLDIGSERTCDCRPNHLSCLSLCPNCADGCQAQRYCDGCDQILCTACYLEHGEDAPCHSSGAD